MPTAMSLRAANTMLGTTDFHRESGRRVITGEDVRQAQAWRRMGRGWQCIAQCLKVNETDLRMMCGDLPDPKKEAAKAASAEALPMLVVPPGTPAWAGRGVEKWRKASTPASVQLLASIARGRQLKAAAEACDMAEHDGWAHLATLRRHAMIARDGLWLTPKGWARLEVAGLATR